MSVTDYSTIELTEEEQDQYLDMLCFAISKGTANVSPADKKKLKGLLRYYAKKKHPFTACVRDNRKRFGAHTEEYCAVLKDLIVGNTKWRGKGKKYTPKNLAENSSNLNLFLTEIEVDEIPEGLLDYLNQLTDEDIATMTGEAITKTEFASGDIVWQPNKSFDYIRRELQEALNESYSTPSASGMAEGYSYWVEDIQDGQALVCHAYNEYYIVPFTMTDHGVSIGEEDTWIPVEKAWVEANLSDEPNILAEMYFDSSDTEVEDGVIWKTIMREGVWAYSPGPGGKAVPKPITVIADGKSDPIKKIISLQELKDNFEAGAKEHVTIPTSHDDKVYENTGFIEQLKIDEDSKGRKVLKAAHKFTDKTIKKKVLDGSIANVSAGILFDYIKKESGKKFNAILGHSALTNSPWLNGMDPWEVNMGEELEIISFSEENEVSSPQGGEKGDMSNSDISTATEQGGEIVSTLDTEAKTTKLFDELGLSEDEVRERLSRLEAVEAENRRNSIDAKCKAWQDEGKSPAIVKEAKAALLSDSGEVAVNLSEDGQTKGLTLSEVVERLVAASPSLKLEDTPVTDEQVVGAGPDADAERENQEATFSDDEKVEIGVMMFDGAMTEAEAIAKVLEARKSNS